MRYSYTINFSILRHFIVVAFLGNLPLYGVFAQLQSGEAFLQGKYVEVAINECGVYGANGSLPTQGAQGTAYHSNSPNGLGFIADPSLNGWGTPEPGGTHNFCGDYFTPGSPEEGWTIGYKMVTTGCNTCNPDDCVTSKINSSTTCTTGGVPGSITSYSYVPGGNLLATWQGTTTDGIEVTQSTRLPEDELYFVTDVQICNTTTDKYFCDLMYARNVDPDQDQVICGTFNTTNNINNVGACQRVVEATGSACGCYVALGTLDPRATPSWGGFFTESACQYDDCDAAHPCTGSTSCDCAISLAFELDCIGPGECKILSYAYVLNINDLQEALDQTASLTGFFNGKVMVWDAGSTTVSHCYGDTLQLKMAAGFLWEWSPMDELYLDKALTTPYTGGPANILYTNTTQDKTYTINSVNPDNPCLQAVTTATVNISVVKIQGTVEDISCFGLEDGEISVDAQGAVNSPKYVWSGPEFIPANTKNPKNLKKGTYYLTVVDGLLSTGCLTDSSFVINEPPILQAGAYTLFVDSCSAGKGAVILSALGGTLPYKYSLDGVTWQPDPMFKNLPAGNYTGFIDDANDCGPHSVNFTITKTPQPNISTTDAPEICAGSSFDLATLNITDSGNAPGTYTYHSNTPADALNQLPSSVVSPTTTTTYYVLETTPELCSDELAITVVVNQLPTFNITPNPAETCQGIPIGLNANPSGGTGTLTSIWTGDIADLDDPNIATPTLNAANAGTFNLTYTVTDSKNCSASATITVVVNPKPIVSPNPNLSVCTGQTITVNGNPAGGTPAYTHIWTGDVTNLSATNLSNPSFNAVAPGTYNLIYTIIDAEGCVATAPVTITVADLIDPVLSNPPSFCTADPAFDLTVSSDPNYPGTWTGAGVSGNTFNPGTAGAGTHAIIYDPADNCASNDTINIVVYLQQTPLLGIPPNLCTSDVPIDLTAFEDANFAGTWAGTGVSGTMFDPAVSGPGIITITFDATDTCILSANLNITVIQSATPILSQPPVVCTLDGIISLTPFEDSNYAGTWSGPGVSGSNFDPTVTGPGNITLTFNASAPCVAPATITIPVYETTTPTLTTIPDQCESGSTISLIPYQDAAFSGTWSGPGVSGSNFNPAIAGPGVHNLSFDPDSTCSINASVSVNVIAAITPSLLTPPVLCEDSAPLDLTTLEDINFSGVWSGAGVSGSSFDPAIAGVGQHTLTFTPSGFCEFPATVIVQVNPLWQPTVITPTPICADNPPVDLMQYASPGTWSGTGVTGGNTFDAALTGAGSFNLTFTSTNIPPDVCPKPTVVIMKVNPSTTPVLGQPAPVCPFDNPVDLDAYGDPNFGGTWSGTGVSGTYFYPDIAGTGIYTITFTPGGGCSNPVSFDIEVLPAPVPVLGTIPDLCAEDPLLDLTPFSDANLPGTWSGMGVSGNSFDPATFPNGGIINLTYTPGGVCPVPVDATFMVFPMQIPQNPSLPTLCESDPIVDLALYTDPNFVGTWSGTGVANDMFDPALAGQGSHILTFTPDGDCTIPVTDTLFVVDKITPTVKPFPELCADDLPIDLMKYIDANLTGAWSGVGVSGNKFSPVIAGVGIHTLLFTPDGSCIEAVNPSIEVKPLIKPILTTPPPLCQGDPNLNLTPFADANLPGTWSGPGVISGDTFDPSLGNSGSNWVVYTPTGTGCLRPDSINVVVNPNGIPILLQPADLCTNSAPLNLTLYDDNSFAGTWSGPGVTGTTFDPAIAGAGSHVLTFDPSGACGENASITVNVVLSATPVLGSPPVLCTTDAAIDLKTLEDAGFTGTWSGPGVAGTMFDPAMAGTGSITVTFTPIGACNLPATINIIVSPTGTPVLLPIANLCTADAAIDLTAYDDANYIGTWSGLGVSGTSFDPATAGAGTHTLTFTPVGLCAQSATINVVVNQSGTPVLGTPPVFLCEDDLPFDLSTIADPGFMGFWGGVGVSSGKFIPSLAGPGVHTVTFSPVGACKSPASVIFIVNPFGKPNIIIPPPMCETDPPLDLTPYGDPNYTGTWIGLGVLGNEWWPLLTGPGTFKLAFEPVGDCSDSTVIEIDVYANWQPIVGTPNPVCANAAPVNLTPYAVDAGNWSGPGVSGTQFDPSALGAGTYTLTFTPTNPPAGTCGVPTTINMVVNDTGIPALTTPVPICISAAAFSLTPYEDAKYSGSWSGVGVSGTNFDPSIAGVGTFTLTFTPSGGCGLPATISIEVLAPEVPSPGALPSVCQTDSPLDLTAYADPLLPGNWSGAGVSGNMFNPSIAGNGIINLTYTPSAACTQSVQVSITVNAPITPALTTPPAQCDNGAVLNLSAFIDAAYPAGTWSGSGVAGNMFDPASVTVGTYTLTFTPSAPCTTPATITVSVIDCTLCFAVTQGTSGSLSLCDGNIPDLSSYEALLIVDQPANLTGIGWFTDAALTTMVTNAFYNFNGPNNCTADTKALYLGASCLAQPNPVAAGNINITIYPAFDASLVSTTSLDCVIPTITTTCANYVITPVNVPSVLNPGDSGTAEWTVSFAGSTCFSQSVTVPYSCGKICPTASISQSAPADACSNDNITLSVNIVPATAVLGVDYSLQWRVNGVNIAGATGLSHSFAAQADDCDVVTEVYDVVFTCLDPGAPAQTIPAGTVAIHPYYSPAVLVVTQGNCIVPSITAPCAEYVITPPANLPSTLNPGDAGTATFTISTGCFNEVFDVNYACNLDCPLVTTPLAADISICDGDAITNFATYESMVAYTDADGQYAGMAWFSDAALTAQLTPAAYVYNGDNCTPDVVTVYLGIICNAGPNVAAGTLTITVYANPDAITQPDVCKLNVASSCANGSITIMYQQPDNSWGPTPAVGATTTNWMAYMVGTPDANADGTPDCVATGSTTLSTPNLSLSAGNDITICEGEIAQLNGLVTNGTASTLLWETSDGGTFDAETTLLTGFTPLAAGVYTLQLSGWDACNNKVSDEVVVTVNTSGKLEISASSTDILLGQTTQLTVTGPNVGLNWQTDPTLSCTDCPDPIATPTATTTYLVMSDSPCVEGNEITINVSVENVVVLPNAFTPNNDNINDVFIPLGANIAKLDMLVYNRWGELMFEGNGLLPTEGWNGEFKGHNCEVGTYVVQAKIYFADGVTRDIKGNITLLR